MSNIDKQALRGLSVESPFYLAECCNCGEIMPSSKLRESRNYPDDDGECHCPHCNADDCDIADSGAVGSEGVTAWNYQQKRIEALLDELEAKDNRINRLEAIVTVAEQRNALMREWKRALKVPCDLVDDQVPVVIHGMVIRLERLKETEEKLEAVKTRIADLESDNAYIRNRHKELDLLSAPNSRAITQHFDTIALETAREIMCDVNRRHEFLGGEVQLLSRIQCRIDDACRSAMLQGADGKPELTVWYGSMPESNGKANWTAILHRKGEGRCMDGFTIDHSEYPGRVLYAADRVRYLIGEKSDRPSILDYDADEHSGYVMPGNSPVIPDGWVMVPVEPTEDMIVNGFESEPDESFSDEREWEAYDAMSGCQQAAHRAKLCWSAMISAAPKPDVR